MDFKKFAALFFIILVAVYFANMYSYKMIDKMEEEKARLLAATPPPTT